MSNPNDVRDKEAEAFADVQPVNAAGQVLIQETFKHAWSQALAKDPRVVALVKAAKKAIDDDYDWWISLHDAIKAFEGGGG